MIISFGVILLMAALSGLLLIFKFSNFDPTDRLIIAALPVLNALIGIALFVIVVSQPLYFWTDVRLARTFAIYHGAKLYQSADTTGPIIGDLHTPVSQLLFGPAVFAPSPTSAIYVASLIAIALILMPLIWLFCFPSLVRPRSLHTAFFALTASGFLLIAGGSIGDAATKLVHTDAAAVGFATIAAGLLCSVRAHFGWRRLLLSAICAVLSIGSKQTMAPIIVALCLFLLLAEGLRATLRYIVCLIGSGAAFALFCIILFAPARDFTFNTIALATHRQERGEGQSILAFSLNEPVPAALPCALLIAAFVFLWLFRNGSTKGVRGLFSEHRWLVFPLVGLLLAPASFKARMTVGGGANHTAIFAFFFSVGIGLALRHFMNKDQSPSHALAAKLFAGSIIAFSIPGVCQQINYFYNALHHEPNYEVKVERYIIQHPNTTYFPTAPLVTYYLEKRFYHVDTMLLDREVAGRPISAAQFADAIPNNPQRIAVPQGPELSRVLQDYVAGWAQIKDPELPRMIVYVRPGAAIPNANSASAP